MQKYVNKCTYVTFWKRQKYNETKLSLITQSNRSPDFLYLKSPVLLSSI